MNCVFSLQMEMPFKYFKNGTCLFKKKKIQKQCRNTEADISSVSSFSLEAMTVNSLESVVSHLFM